MAISISIRSLTNNNDGIKATVVIDGLPNSVISFNCGREPEYERSNPCVYHGSGPYVLMLPSPNLWYVWILDGGQPCLDPEAVWISKSDDEDLNECGLFIEQRLVANKKGLEASIRPIYPQATIKQIVYGLGSAVMEFPSIIVSNPSDDTPWRFAPFGSEADFNLQIAVIIQRMDEQTELAAATRLTRAVQRILSQPANLEITLPCGSMLVNARTQAASISERQLADRWLSIGILNWSAMTLYLDRGDH